MTVKELQKLIDRKIQKTYEEEELFKSCYPNANDYYEGIRRGLKDDNGDLKDYDGFRTLYTSTANCAKNNLAHLKRLYKQGKYGELTEWAKVYSERLEDFYIIHGIKEISSE